MEPPGHYCLSKSQQARAIQISWEMLRFLCTRNDPGVQEMWSSMSIPAKAGLVLSGSGFIQSVLSSSSQQGEHLHFASIIAAWGNVQGQSRVKSSKRGVTRGGVASISLIPGLGPQLKPSNGLSQQLHVLLKRDEGRPDPPLHCQRLKLFSAQLELKTAPGPPNSCRQPRRPPGLRVAVSSTGVGGKGCAAHPRLP